MLRFVRMQASHVAILREWFADDAPVAEVGFEILEPGAGVLSILVAPEARRRGWGVRVRQALTTRPEVRALQRRVAWVDPENAASRKLAELS